MSKYDVGGTPPTPMPRPKPVTQPNTGPGPSNAGRGKPGADYARRRAFGLSRIAPRK